MRDTPPEFDRLEFFTKLTRSAGLCATLGAHLLFAASVAVAQNAPLPPRRPALVTPKAPPPPAEPAPPARPPVSVVKKPEPLANLPATDTSAPPPLLPRAPREKMHGCAVEWTKMKLETTSDLPTWREFAVKCLTR